MCAGFLQFVKYTELTKDVGQHAVRENVCRSAFVAIQIQINDAVLGKAGGDWLV